MSTIQGLMSGRAATLGSSVKANGRLVPAFFAVLLGCLVVGTTGFASIDVVHNAAHDVRHASGFPCH